MPLANNATKRIFSSGSYLYGSDENKKDSLFTAEEIIKTFSSNSQIFTFTQLIGSTLLGTINGQDSFEILNPPNTLFRIIDRTASPTKVKIYKLITKPVNELNFLQIGNYGVSGQQISITNLVLINESQLTFDSIIGIESTVVYDLQDIGENSIVDYVNALAESISIEAPETNFTVFKISTNNTISYFLYEGSGDIYSINNTEITEEELGILPNEGDSSILVVRKETDVTTYLFESSNRTISPLFTSSDPVSAVVKVGIPIGTKFLLAQWGTGEVTVTGQSGVTLKFPSNKLAVIDSQYSWMQLEVVGVNQIAVTGDLKLA